MLITGCDKGFGYALAWHLHAQGFTVFAGCLLKVSGRTESGWPSRPRRQVQTLASWGEALLQPCKELLLLPCSLLGKADAQSALPRNGSGQDQGEGQGKERKSRPLVF